MDKMALSNTVPGSIYTIHPTPFNYPRAYIGYEHRIFDSNSRHFIKLDSYLLIDSSTIFNISIWAIYLTTPFLKLKFAGI